jgi:hypothetical protein
MIIHILLVLNIVAVEPRFPGKSIIHKEWQYAGDYASKELCEIAAQKIRKERDHYVCVQAE